MKPPFDQSEGQASGARAARQAAAARAKRIEKRSTGGGGSSRGGGGAKRSRDSDSSKGGRIANGRLVVAKVDETWILAREFLFLCLMILMTKFFTNLIWYCLIDY